MQHELRTAAEELAAALGLAQRRVVFAESCTGGLVSAALVGVPGISEWHCGSAVVYRFDTKCQWLGVDREKLDDPGPVSDVIAEQMAAGALDRTPEADLAVSVTGELGPYTPRLDGTVVIGWRTREGLAGSETIGLKTRDRDDRQCEAAVRVLHRAVAVLESM